MKYEYVRAFDSEFSFKYNIYTYMYFFRDGRSEHFLSDRKTLW